MNITLPIKENPQQVLEDVKKKVTAKGGSFSGDLSTGKFSVLGIKGEYRIVEQKLLISIISKPFFIPDSMIKDEVNRYFNSL